MEVIMYTTHCPQCSVLAKKLEQKKINFKEIDNIDIMTDLGIISVPMLSINNGPFMDFKKSVEWINSLEA